MRFDNYFASQGCETKPLGKIIRRQKALAKLSTP